MVDLQSDRALFYWVHDDFQHFCDIADWGSTVFAGEQIPSFAVGKDFVTIDSPKSWTEAYGDPIYSMKFTLGNDGMYVYDDGYGFVYEGVRADTSSHVILTGTYKEPDDKGTFIAVLPKANKRT